MQIGLHYIAPIPLKEKFSQRQSEVWNTALRFDSPEWIKIVAPSGTGKTTLMNILYKVRHDYEGSVTWNEVELKTTSGDALASMRQQKVSVIFQDLRLFENLTAYENIELNRIMQKPFYEAKMIAGMAGLLGITSILNQKAALCSYGEQQRIAVIRALVQPFEWLLMDEPFSHLDKANTQKAVDLIARECKVRNAGFILTGLDEDSLFDYTRVYRL